MPTEQTDAMAYMQNRELSWLKFNERVLQEANRDETPLLERLKFVSIFTSNLDEFFMVRVGSLTDSALLDESYQDNKTGMNAKEQLEEIFRAVAPLYTVREQAYASVMEELAQGGVELLRMCDADNEALRKLKKYFQHYVEPLLSPQIIDSRHPFPHLANTRLYVAVTLEKKKGQLFGVIEVPAELDRLVFPEEGKCRFVLLEDLIFHFAEQIFSMYKVTEKNIISVTRNADINTEEELLDEDIDYRQHMKNLLKKRQRLSPVRLEAQFPASPAFTAFFCEKLHLAASQLFCVHTPLDLSFCFGLDRAINEGAAKKLLWSPHVPAETLPAEKKANMLKTALGKDMLFSYPFESISPFLELVRQAAEDPTVASIKITLYRIDSQSKLAESLIRAAENGKEVTVLMELRARFDENNNIEWAQRLEEAGCRVIYGLQGYKVHSKVCLIVRKEFRKIQYITQIGTGNFNEKTAKQYTDLALITANQDIGHDAAAFFANLMLGNLEGDYTHLWVAPGGLKSNILQCIEVEREKAKSGLGGRIIIKCNSLTDKELIESLAAASCDGVDISMIVRGICCLVPQIAQRTDHIRIVSIVGRFLEHSRIFCFGTGDERKVYLSSADLMTRNTQRRIEVACPILEPALRDRLCQMLETMLMDNVQAWELYADGRYIPRRPAGTDIAIDSQALFTRQAAEAEPRSEAKSGSKGEAAAGLKWMQRLWQRMGKIRR